MATKKTKSPIHPSDDLAAIDDALNAAMELVDVTNVRVTEILQSTDIDMTAAGLEDSSAEDDASEVEAAPKTDAPPKPVVKGSPRDAAT